jgi:hypothetical protein
MRNRASLFFVSLALLFGVIGSAAGAETKPITVDEAAKRSESAGVGIEIVFRGMTAEGIVFDVAFDTMKMDAPPLERDLSKLATLVVDGGPPVKPSSWTIRQTGHMGHHVRGRLLFPAEADGRPVIGSEAKAFELRLAGAQGEPQGAFAWRLVSRSSNRP